MSYTFSKGLGHNSANSFDLSRTYGPLPWDHTQALKISYNRAEAFNFLNHPIYGVTNFDPFRGPGTSDGAMNLLYDSFGSLPTNASTAGIMTNKFGRRIVQLALKFYF